MNTFEIDYSSIESRQEFLSIYYLYFYMVQYNRYDFDLGHYVIALLNYIVENGRLDFYSMPSSDIRTFTNQYFHELNLKNTLTMDDLNNILNRLEGINGDGTPIVYKHGNTSERVSYVAFDIEEDGYKITDTGLQFLISSKEVPQESKLTISLYLFRLQIDKHKYQSALDTIVNINMETKRQLSIKDKILDVAKYDAQLGNKMYNDYWKDFASLRDEEREHYRQAKEFLKECQSLSNDDVTPKDREILRKIENELNVSTTLQNRYILEISSMGKEMANLSLNSINNVFENHFNFAEHIESAYKSDDPLESLKAIIMPLLQPKRLKYFDVSMAFAPQLVKSKISTHPDDTIKLDKVSPVVDVSKQYQDRKFKNYRKYFAVMVNLLETSPIYDIREYIAQLTEDDIQAVDFLSYLIDLSGFSELNTSIEDNRQTIRLTSTYNDITCDTFEGMLSKFWFEFLGKSHGAELYVTTNTKDIVYLDALKRRSIGNLKVSLRQFDNTAEN